MRGSTFDPISFLSKFLQLQILAAQRLDCPSRRLPFSFDAVKCGVCFATPVHNDGVAISVTGIVNNTTFGSEIAVQDHQAMFSISRQQLRRGGSRGA